MTTIGAFEAKTHLSALLERTARGETVTITRHGRPVARLVPAEDDAKARAAAAVERLKRIRAGSSLGGLDWRELRDTGRR